MSMDSQKVDLFIMNSANLLPAEHVPMIRQRLLDADENKMLMVQSMNLKKPMVAFLLNFFFGTMGADYFYLGKAGLGIAKLLTCGGIGIWWIINLFRITGLTKKCNYEKLMMVL